jgi:hypothetical protein
MASSAGHHPGEDLLGLGTLADGTWGVQGKPKDRVDEVRDDASSVYSHDSTVDAHTETEKMKRGRRAQGPSKLTKEETEGESLFGDHEDYSKRVGGGGKLGVRNVTDLDRARSMRSSMDS